MPPARFVDLVDPSSDEVLTAVPAALDPDAVAQLVAAADDARPILESHAAYVLGVLVVPLATGDPTGARYAEIDVVATAEAVVTVRKSDGAGRLAEVAAVAARAEEGASAGELVHVLVDSVAEDYLDLLDSIHAWLDGLEDGIETLPGRAARTRLTALRHELQHARRNVALTRSAVRRVVDGRLELAHADLFPHELELAFADTYDVLIRITEELDIARDVLSGIRDHLQARVAEGQNDVIKKLTVIASLVLVPTLITGFYGQNFADAFDDRYWSLGTSAALIAGSTVAQLVLFRWRRWI